MCCFWLFLGTQIIWNLISYIRNFDMNQNTTFYIDIKSSSFIKNLIWAVFGHFWPFLAIFGHFWVPRVLENFPNGYLTLKYIKIYHFTPILGLQLSPESHFTQLGPICAILGCFWPFLDTQSSWKFSKWLPNIEIHQDITFYTYFGGYCSLQNLISPN